MAFSGRSGGGAAASLGYEPALLAELPAKHRAQLDSLSIGWGLSCVCLALPAGVLAWRIEHSVVLATSIALGAALLAANALRLLVAGGGVPADRPWPASYRPARMAGVLVGALSLVLAQPAQLLLDSPAADTEVRAHRAALLSAHREALSTQGSGPVGSGGSDAFQRRLADCEFVVLRLGLMWTQPQRAGVFTALFALLVLAPFLLSRSVWLPAVSDYERVRHQRDRARARAELRRTDAQVEAALARFPSYDAGARSGLDSTEARE